MPATLVHCAAVDLLAKRSDLPNWSAEALAAEPEAGRLGALLPDLPHFGHFRRQVVQHILKLPPSSPGWSTVLHSEPPSLLGKNLIELLRKTEKDTGPGEGPLGRRAAALIAGYHSHVALDLTHHFYVEDLATKIQREEGGNKDMIHRRIEKFHSLFLLEDLHGVEIAGTPRASESLRVLGGGKTIGRRMTRYLHLAFQSSFGRSPSENNLREWVGGIVKYSALISGPLGRRERRRTEADRRACVEALGVPASELLEGALSLSSRLCLAAEEFYSAPDGRGEETYLAAVPEDNLSVPAKNHMP